MAKKAKKTTAEKAEAIKSGGAKEILKSLALAAVSLAGQHDFAGLSGDFGPNVGQKNSKVTVTAKTGKNKGQTIETTTHKAMANKIQPKWSPKGSLASLAETDPTFVALKGLAKSAQADIVARNYSGSVKAFLNAMAVRGSGGGGGMRSREELASIGDNW